MTRPPTADDTTASWRLAVAVLLASLAGLAVLNGGAARAAPPLAPEDFESLVSQEYIKVIDFGTLPDCGPININGRKGSATWSVGSTRASGSVVDVGDTWTITAEVRARRPDLSGGNDGPDPLYLRVVPTGPAATSGPPTGEQFKEDLHSFGATGVTGPYGKYGMEFDVNSSPKLIYGGDGAHVRLHYEMVAAAPGVITLPKLEVFGHDATPQAGDFSCSIPVGFSWTVDAVDPPTSGSDKATVDASYAADTLDDANGGVHTVEFDVLANDNDPEVAGGPGDTSEVRIKDWDDASFEGGALTCGTPAQNNEPDFAEMSTGPCTYSPPPGYAGPDSFQYALASVSGKVTIVNVSISVIANTAPFFDDVTVGAVSNTPTLFDLSDLAHDVNAGDTYQCTPGVANASGSVAGFVTIDQQCDASWVPSNAGTGQSSFPLRVCDRHATRQNGQLGANVTRAGGYETGSPDDMSATQSSRCRDGEVTINIASGLLAPPLANTDGDVVDAGYAADGVGAYSVRIPVLENDSDVNGPQPADAGSGVQVGIINPPDPAAGTAAFDGDDIVFTPTEGYAGPAGLTYRVCEDPAQQNPVYEDNPNTPAVNEGLPFCGVGTVAIEVVGNEAPTAEPDAAITTSIVPITQDDLRVNDVDPEDEGMECTPGPLDAAPAGLVASASVDADCLADVTPVVGAAGVATMTYRLCDAHTLTTPESPDVPYGADGRSPGDLAPRCTTGTYQVAIVEPASDDPGVFELDPPPVCADDTATVAAGGAIAIEVLSNDTDTDLGGDPSPLSVVDAGLGDQTDTTANGGVVSPTDDGGRVGYSPPAGFVGTDTFDYSAQDTAGHGCSAEVTVTVTAATTGASVAVDVGPAATDTGLARTGWSPWSWIALALVLIVGGIQLRVAARSCEHRPPETRFG